MECLELAEVIDQFGWLTEICMTIFGGKEGFIVVCLIKLTGVILDFVAFVLAAEANGVCEGLSPHDFSDDSFGSDDSVSELCIFYFTDLFKTVVYFMLSCVVLSLSLIWIVCIQST